MRRQSETGNEQRDEQQKKWARRIHLSIYRFAPENQTGTGEENRQVAERIKQRERKIQPRNQRPVVDDEVAHVEQFQMRKRKINCIDDGADRFMQRERDLVQMPADK